jgi:ubiquinone/menaquinone biosynthesis C-methylase UbiE
MASYYTQTWFDSPMIAALNRFIKLLPNNNNRVLDVACGSGRDSSYLAKEGLEIVGIDLSTGMINEARARVPKVDFHVMDMRDLQFRANYFGGIWACAALVHIPPQEIPRVLQSFHHVMSDQAALFIAVQEKMPEIGRNNPIIAEDGRYFAFFSEVEMVDWLKGAEFELIDIQRQFTTQNTYHLPITVNWLHLWARK